MEELYQEQDQPEDITPERVPNNSERASQEVAISQPNQNYEQYNAVQLRALLAERDASIAGQKDDGKPSVPPEVLAMEIDDINPSVRLFNALYHGGVRTVGDLPALTYEKILTFNGMGPRLAKELKGKLGELGITIPEE
jgi:DNA-directed RNA polymerase alpha subunit